MKPDTTPTPRTTKHLARELTLHLAGPPRVSQTDFAERAKIDKSKLCRLLASTTACDKESLDAILAAVPNREGKARLVQAYIRDLASPGAICSLQPNDAADPWSQIRVAKLSRRGESALRWLIEHRLESAEKIITDLAGALGWKP